MGASQDRKSAKAKNPRTGRRARHSLSRESILEAAETVAVRDGFEGLTFQALGRELDAHPTSIYRHFRDKDELVLELVDSLRARSYGGRLQATDSWRDDLRAQARHIHDHYLRYPQFALQMAARTTRRPAEFSNVEFALDAFVRAGLPPEEAATCMRVFGNVIRSLASMESGLQALDAETLHGDSLAWQVEYRGLSAEEYPRIASLSDHLTDIGNPQVFDRAVEMFLDAVEVRVARLASHAP
ncbi:TetR/AcrR family transcriptional regulator [Streptomyces sp. NBC_01716]|uniref:TetR/AcrR family transcriptional regulator n=1 Tax=Streptomyces sp. NBC_01716 TaxID=2975917 RepID=UPI002E36524E|nr:helix-turn-helix domain-containing protein [Streptomyces sp. NBC_01716]